MMPKRKDINEATLPELRAWATDVENLSWDGAPAGKMSRVDLLAKLKELGYDHIYVAPPQKVADEVVILDGKNIGLTDEDEHWYKIRIENAPNPNGKSKNVPVPVAYNEYVGYIPRGTPVWIRGRFVNCLEEAIEVHTYQDDISMQYDKAKRTEERKRYPYQILARAGLVIDGLPRMAEGEQIIHSDKNLRAARARMDAARKHRPRHEPIAVHA